MTTDKQFTVGQDAGATANRVDSGQIPYHQAYFGCCNRTVMTREDIAQPKFCPFCGKACDKSVLLKAEPQEAVANTEGLQRLIEKWRRMAEHPYFDGRVWYSKLADELQTAMLITTEETMTKKFLSQLTGLTLEQVKAAHTHADKDYAFGSSLWWSVVTAQLNIALAATGRAGGAASWII